MENKNELYRNDKYNYIKVGKDHPVADSSGYALEHRVIMHDLLGDVVLKGQIHHIDGNGKNNSIDNLVFVTLEQHARLHSPLTTAVVRLLSQGDATRKDLAKYLDVAPSKVSNILTTLKKKGNVFLTSHNTWGLAPNGYNRKKYVTTKERPPRNSLLREDVLEQLRDGSKTRKQIADKTGRKRQQISDCLLVLKRANVVIRVGGRGWALSPTSTDQIGATRGAPRMLEGIQPSFNGLHLIAIPYTHYDRIGIRGEIRI